VLLAEDLLCKLQRLLVERLGYVVPALTLKEDGEIIYTSENIKVLFAEDLLSELQRLPIK
jgi:hypothetical protein